MIDKLHAEVVRALARPDMRNRLETDGAIPLTNTPAEFAAFIRSEMARWGRVVREAGVTAD